MSGRRPLLLALVSVALLGGAAVAGPQRFSWAVAVLPSGAEFRLEIAADTSSRARGYMFRERVGPDEGMLFVFPSEERQSFWMKNCKVALDMIFLDGTLRVVEIAHEQQPCPEDGPCPQVAPLRPARYVLEVAGGVAARQGLEIGDRVRVLSEPALP